MFNEYYKKSKKKKSNNQQTKKAQWLERKISKHEIVKEINSPQFSQAIKVKNKNKLIKNHRIQINQLNLQLKILELYKEPYYIK